MALPQFGNYLRRVHRQGTRKFPTFGSNQDSCPIIPTSGTSFIHPIRTQIRHLYGTSSMIMPTQAGSDPPQLSLIKTVNVVVKGKVQGVFYRDWTVENAKQLDLKGWVRNRRDGSVEALFSGTPEAVQEMGQRCRRGPPASMVTALYENRSTDDPGTDFVRKPTV